MSLFLSVWPWITLSAVIILVAGISEYNGRVPRALRLLNTTLIVATIFGFGRMVL